MLSPWTAWSSYWPLPSPSTPLQQCLTISAWLVSIVGVLFPLLLLHRMERSARLSAAGVATGRHGGKQRFFLNLYACGVCVWSAASIALQPLPDPG